MIRVNYRNNNGGGYPQHYYPPHSPHGGHHRQALTNKSEGLSSLSKTFGVTQEIDPPASAAQIQESLAPVVVPATAAELVEKTEAPAKGGLFSLDKLGDIKGFVDRLGGIDGILNTVTKVQKVVSTVSQMAPMVKVLMGSFKKSSDDSDESDEFIPKKRKRRRKRTGAPKGQRKRKSVKKKL
ncbi:hypothetical protein [Paenibacillus radicis (ex Gao et al. 2016)]|uniref:Tyrosine protein kinase n=1 Tax=Paenibacillus radicis (ex Gao et al. 2016) TaxID=1737354 RepID=A0A917HHD2_9BACL|nr:hypothetical protein [Paenibacillus radicis (ex Gao et al. 2016)]GGG78565.1 hypothetical protein GCM10010918_39370 [Paenibacillus radicis (ex Gao et al. 2016)]